MLINLFPAETGDIQAVAALLLAAVALGVGFTTFVFWRRASRRRLAVERALQHGLSARSAQFFAAVFQHETAGTAESLLTAPDLLTKRLVLAIARQHGSQAALRFAADAAALLDELDLRTPAFEGAPLPCEPLLLSDPSDPNGPAVVVFVGAADEKNLIVVSPSACPWPLRRNLVAMPQSLPGVGANQLRSTAADSGAGIGTDSGVNSGANVGTGAGATGKLVANSDSGASADSMTTTAMNGAPPRRPAFAVALLLRPMPPLYEWVLTHSLVETITNRRATVRVPCRIETFALPDSGDPLLLRQRLQREESVQLGELRGTRAWSQRLTVTVVDMSADGARLLLDQPLAKHQRVHLLFARPDDSLLALPLAEVVDSKHDFDGRTVVGVRFIGVRMKERLCLADFVRVLARPVSANVRKLPREPGRQREQGL